ncbi:MAG: GyrI-like domain-containing protein [Protaetiibacter sp.]
MPEKVDLKKTDAYRAKRGEFRILDVPLRGYLAIDGEGDPNTAAFTLARDKSRWSWTLLILQPDWIDASRLEEVRAVVARKGASARSAEVRFETLDESRRVQTLHLGSFDDEAPPLARMHDEFIAANGLVMTGHHHEIYLSDPRRAAPAKLRTILRQPVASAL